MFSRATSTFRAPFAHSSDITTRASLLRHTRLAFYPGKDGGDAGRPHSRSCFTFFFLRVDSRRAHIRSDPAPLCFRARASQILAVATYCSRGIPYVSRKGSQTPQVVPFSSFLVVYGATTTPSPARGSCVRPRSRTAPITSRQRQTG